MDDLRDQPLQKSENVEKLQNNIASWTKNNELKPISIDLPDVVNLFQVLGYRVNHADICPDSYGLPNGEDGCRIVVTCSHSGQRFVMQKTSIKDSCRCTNVGPVGELGYSTLEVQSERLESNELIPKLTNEQIEVIKPMMGYVFNLMKSEPHEVQPDVKAVTILNGDLLQSPENLEKKDQLDVPQKTEQKSRSMSFGALPSIVDREIPIPGTLVPKIVVGNQAQSSPNINLASNEDLQAIKKNRSASLESDGINGEALNMIKSATETLNKAILMLGNSSNGKPSRSAKARITSASKTIKKFVLSSKPSQPINKGSSTSNLNSTKSTPLKPSSSTSSLSTKTSNMKNTSSKYKSTCNKSKK